MSKPSGGDGTDDALAEWQAGRDLINSFDERIHDLRKYGFSFVTALLAAQSLLIPSLVPLPPSASSATSASAPSGDIPIPDAVKLGVLLVTLLLVFALRLDECNYQFFQEAAKDRLLVLERNLNLELTEVITDRFNVEGISISSALVYVLFSVGVFAVGYFVLKNPEHTEVLFAITVLVVLFTFLLPRFTSLRYQHIRTGECWKEDWTIDKLECRIGETVRITLTNMERNTRDSNVWERRWIRIPEGSIVWEVQTESGDVVYRKSAATGITIAPQNNYTWEWRTADENEIGFGEGICRILTSSTTDDSRLLDRLLGRKKPGRRTPWPAPRRRKVRILSGADPS
jgi:hypothetical protein